MSIVKAKNTLKHNKLSFTVILNEVCQGIRHTGAAGVYLYLASKPENWEICKTELQRHFNCATKHMNTCFKKLKELGLIQIISHKKNGKITHWETVLNDRIYIKPVIARDSNRNIQNGYSENNDLSTSTIPILENVEKSQCEKGAITKERDLQNKERKKNKDVNDVPSSKAFSFEELRIRQLVLTKLGGKALTLKQTKLLIKNHHKDSKIEKSLENCIFHMNIPSKNPIKNPVACFLYHINSKGYFEDKRIYTKIQNADEVRAHENALNKDMDLDHTIALAKASNMEFKSFEEALTEIEAELGFSLRQS